MFSNVWPSSSAAVSSSSSSSHSNVENGASLQVLSHNFAAASSPIVSTVDAPFPVPAQPTSTHHHVEPAAVPVVANMHPAMAPEALLDAVNEGSVAQVHAILARDPSLANHRDGFGQVCGGGRAIWRRRKGFYCGRIGILFFPSGPHLRLLLVLSLLSLIPCAPIILSTLSPPPPFLPSPFHRRPPSCGRPTRAGWRWSPAFSTAALASTSARRAEPARPCTWPVSSTMRPWWPCSSQGGPTPPWQRNEVGGALGEEGGRERGGRGREDEEYA